MISLLFAAQIQTAIDPILDVPELANAWVGIAIANPSGEIVYQRNADKLFMPASNTKLFSAAFALHEVGPNWKSQTRIWKQPDGIYIDAQGDPLLKWNDWAQIRGRLGVANKRNVFVKHSFRPGFFSEWEVDDIPFRYAAVISSLTIDGNAFELWASQGKLEPIPNEIGVKPHYVKSAGEPNVNYDPIRKKLAVTGTLPQTRTRIERLAMPDPEMTIAKILGGHYKAVSKLPKRKPDIVLASKSMRDLVAASLAPSDNNVAENLLFLASGGGRSTFETAAGAMASFLNSEVKISPDLVRLKDGSGVSRHNLISPLATVQLLCWVRKQPWSIDFEAGLAAPGIGTLEKRLASSTFRGKTGTADTVSNLSGYLGRPGDSPWVVSILINHATCKTSKLHQIQDALVREIEKMADNGTYFAVDYRREGNLAHPFFGGALDHWLYRPGLNRGASR